MRRVEDGILDQDAGGGGEVEVEEGHWTSIGGDTATNPADQEPHPKCRLQLHLYFM